MGQAWVELFGLASVSVMVGSYALERRARVYVLVFAIACLCASTYAALIRSWPFAAVELIWSVVAFRRWSRSPALALKPTPRSGVRTLRG